MTTKPIILFILFTSLLLASCGDRTPDKIFCAALDCNKLRSTKILHAEDYGFDDCCIWLHFKVDSIELANELRSCRAYEFFTIDTLVQEAKWWNPRKMGDSIKCFQRNHDIGFETFYVNQKGTEVYYQNFFN